MGFPRTFVIAAMLLVGSMVAAPGDSEVQVAVDPSDVEWTAERYLRARPIDPLRVRSVSRDLPGEGLSASFSDGSVGAPGRPRLLAWAGMQTPGLVWSWAR